MPSKEREYIEKMRRAFRSPILLKEAAEARWGTGAEEKMSFDEARQLYDEAHCWSTWNNIAMQDYLAQECGYSCYDFNEDNPRPYVKKVLEAVGVMANHLEAGQKLGLSELEQRVVDTLWGWVPHDYPDNYVACAREVSETILRLLPPEDSKKSEEGYKDYCNMVVKEVTQLASKYNVDFETSDYNLSAGYFFEWLPEEYGMIFDDAWDREF